MYDPELPKGGPSRLRYYAVSVVRQGVPPVWAASSVIVGAGLIGLGSYLLHYAVLWVLCGVLAILLVVVVIGGYRVWTPLARSVDPIKGRLDEGFGLESAEFAGTVPRGNPHNDALYEWAHQTWLELRYSHPSEARAFFGEEAPYDPGYFRLAFQLETDNNTRRYDYLKQRLELLARLAG